MRIKYCYTAILEKDDNGYAIWIPDLEGCISSGGTVVDAIKNMKEALELYIEVLVEKGRKINQPSQPEDIKTEKGQILAIIEFDRLGELSVCKGE